MGHSDMQIYFLSISSIAPVVPQNCCCARNLSRGGPSSVAALEESWARWGSLSVATTVGSWACGGLLSVAVTVEVGLVGDCRLLEMLEEVRIVGEYCLLPPWGKLGSCRIIFCWGHCKKPDS